jgi:hypothetical protein
MVPAGYITDGEGRRVFALVPAPRLWSDPEDPPRSAAQVERAALEALLVQPGACLDLPGPVNPIRAARVAAGITQVDLAFALGISQPMLSRQERPFRRVRPATVARALDAIRRIQASRGRPTV